MCVRACVRVCDAWCVLMRTSAIYTEDTEGRGQLCAVSYLLLPLWKFQGSGSKDFTQGTIFPALRLSF